MQFNFANEVKISRGLAGHGNSDTRLLHFKETGYLRVPSQVKVVIRSYVHIVGSESLML